MANEKPKLEQCPKFEGCNALACPLYDHWRISRTNKSGATCFYLREATKEDAKDRFRGRKDEAIFRIALGMMLLMKRRDSVLRGRLEKSSRSGSRIDAAKATHR